VEEEAQLISQLYLHANTMKLSLITPSFIPLPLGRVSKEEEQTVLHQKEHHHGSVGALKE
jgi:hypothetical protein